MARVSARREGPTWLTPTDTPRSDGGPAGVVLGYLLARAGVETCVLEKHGDFLRDFRGDTLHPSTIEVMYEFGLLDALLVLPHDELSSVRVNIGGEAVTVADLSHLTACKFVALMLQWHS